MAGDAEEVIDVWEVHPHMNTDFDYAVFDCHVRAAEYVKELAEMMIDEAGAYDEFTIEIKHRLMTRHDYEESCG